MKILFVTSEVVPFAKTGGLADVCGSLPREVARLGHDVRVVMPRYGQIDRAGLAPDTEPVGVPTGVGERWCLPLRATLPRSTVPITFLEHDALFDRPALYGPSASKEYGDNCLRFTVLCRGALQLCHKDRWFPDVIHCHDWQAALVPAFLRAFETQSPLARVATLLTIHNLAYQGRFNAHDMEVTGLGWEYFTWRSFEFHGGLNLLKGGIAMATLMTTVSPSYAQEIQTAQLGEALDPLLRHRFDRLRGVLNGIDVETWNPATDTTIPARYDRRDLGGKEACKAALRKIAGWQHRGSSSERIVAGFVGRLIEQKGGDLILEAVPRLLELGVEVVVLGTGNPELERRFRSLSEREPELSAWLEFNDELAHLVQAGSDLLLMPSRYEPCGLNQLYALRYGTLPIVTNVGGLRDSVVGDSEGNATGFKLAEATTGALVEAVRRAVTLRREQPHRFLEMVQRAMTQPLGWDRAASQYVRFYEEAVALAGG